MISLQELNVRPGEQISATKWNRLLAYLRSCQVVGGREIDLRRTPHGTFVSARPAAWPLAMNWLVNSRKDAIHD